MPIELSISIPSTEEDFFTRYNKKIETGFPLVKHSSIWSSTIYEIWIENNMELNVFIDLNFKLNILCQDLEHSIIFKNFSKINCKYLEENKLNIIFGIRLLSKTMKTLMTENIRRMIKTIEKFLLEKEKYK